MQIIIFRVGKLHYDISLEVSLKMVISNNKSYKVTLIDMEVKCPKSANIASVPVKTSILSEQNEPK